MKITEFYEAPQQPEFDFDLVEDLIVFMKNDTMFYRRHYFEAMTKLSDAVEANKKIDPTAVLAPMVKQAMQMYCKKFDLGKSAEKVFSAADIKATATKIYAEEKINIQQGLYRAKK